ncbi:MAG TPA: hypothetical protein DHV28_03030 [Ignavibacteriales bacterium]|nr:hypothetical protein [Ignavibacteriales bacterium]
MLTFLLILILVFIGVDLLVRFVIDPLASGSNKKSKVSKSYSQRFDPTIKLATETMYDGGKPHNEVKSTTEAKDADISKETNKNLEQ